MSAAVPMVQHMAPPFGKGLVLPVYRGEFGPRRKNYERLVAPHRELGVRIYLLTVPFGVVPESKYFQVGQLIDDSTPYSDRHALRSTILNVRRWLMVDAPRHDRVVFLGYGEGGYIWSRALKGLYPSNLRHVGVNRRSRGIDSSMLPKKISGALK